MNTEKDIAAIKALLPALMGSLELFVQDIDWQKRTARVLITNRKFFQSQSFLDDRVLEGNPVAADVPLSALWPIVDQAQDGALSPCRFIFHIGYCGSTLFSRLFDELPGVLGVREPFILRPFAARENLFGVGEGLEMKDDMARELARAYALLARTFKADETVIVKTTSICTAIADQLLAFNQHNRGLFLRIPLKTYLATLLTRDEQLDAQSFSDHSLLGLKKRAGDVDINLVGLSKGQLLAVNWLSIALDLQDFVESPLADRGYFLDFDEFWHDTPGHTKAILEHFGLPHDDETVSRLLESKVFTSYSKEPGIPYTRKTREKVLADSEKAHAADIKEGLAYADALDKQYPSLAPALAYVGLT